MKFLDYITIDSILFLPRGLDKCGAVRYMVTNAFCFGSLYWTGDTESVIRAILKREELGTTAWGRGVACPHTKHPDAHEIILAVVGHSAEGVDFDSWDGEPIHVFFLWVSPSDRPEDHLKYCAMVSRQARDDTFLRFLKQSRTPEDIWQLLQEADDNQFGS